MTTQRKAHRDTAHTAYHNREYTPNHRKTPQIAHCHIPTTHTAHYTHNQPKRHKRDRSGVCSLLLQCLLSFLCHTGASCMPGEISVVFSQGGSPRRTVDGLPSRVWRKALLQQFLTRHCRGIFRALRLLTRTLRFCASSSSSPRKQGPPG